MSCSTQDNFPERNPTRGDWFQSYEVAVGGSGRRHAIPVAILNLDLLEQQPATVVAKLRIRESVVLDGVLLVAPAMHTTKYMLVR